MLPHERIYLSISGKIPDRVPNVPKIWVDLGARLTQTDLSEVIQNPLTALRVIADAALLVGADGARQFHLPKRKIIQEMKKSLKSIKKENVLEKSICWEDYRPDSMMKNILI